MGDPESYYKEYCKTTNKCDKTYKGGKFKALDKKKNILERHHVPADSTSSIPRNDGPAIEMDYEDHRKTASCGNSNKARKYRNLQKSSSLRSAITMDIKDIIKQYVKC